MDRVASRIQMSRRPLMARRPEAPHPPCCYGLWLNHYDLWCGGGGGGGFPVSKLVTGIRRDGHLSVLVTWKNLFFLFLMCLPKPWYHRSVGFYCISLTLDTGAKCISHHAKSTQCAEQKEVLWSARLRNERLSRCAHGKTVVHNNVCV